MCSLGSIIAPDTNNQVTNEQYIQDDKLIPAYEAIIQ